VTEGPRRFDDFVVLSPILGGKGHGVPEMMNAVFYKSGNIRWQVAVVESRTWAAAVAGRDNALWNGFREGRDSSR
jgi:chloride channel protein, CIC family